MSDLEADSVPPAPTPGAAFVPTVLGPIDPSALGTTLTHEHVSVDWLWAIGAEHSRDESDAAADLAVDRLDRAYEAGVRSFVDVGATIAPSPSFMRTIAQRTRLTLLVSTGCFAPEMTPLPSWAYPPGDAETIAARFIEDAVTGLGGSGVHPAVIKIASGARAISELEETIFRAAALAQQETGLAITTHTTLTHQAVEQAELLAEAGADVRRVTIGHIGWGTGPQDKELHLEVAERGVFLGLDMVGLPAASIDEWTQMVVDLLDAGHAEQILLSHDNCGHHRGLVDVFGEEWLTGKFTVIHDELLPSLRVAGVEESVLHQILVDNPRRLLAIDPTSYPRPPVLGLGPRGVASVRHAEAE
jgi:phosphotriesterase-related protein